MQPKEMVAFLILLNQLVCKFGTLVKDILEEIFPIIASRVFNVLQGNAFLPETGGNTEVRKHALYLADFLVAVEFMWR